MTQYKLKNRVVDAYQHKANPNNDTAAYPQWFLNLLVAERIRPMPDESVHVESSAGGPVMPLPIGYWLTREVNDDEEILSVVAPDIFAANYEEV